MSLYPFDTVFRFNFATSGTSARERRDSGEERLGRSLAAPTNGRVSLRFGLVTPDPRRLRRSSVLSSSLLPPSVRPFLGPPTFANATNQSVAMQSILIQTDFTKHENKHERPRQNLSQTAKTSSQMSSLNRGEFEFLHVKGGQDYRSRIAFAGGNHRRSAGISGGKRNR